MKKLARTAVNDARSPGTRVCDARPAAGLVSLVGEVVRRLLPPRSRESISEGGEPERKREQDPGTYRSAMAAGITGGFSLLGAGSGEGKRRR